MEFLGTLIVIIGAELAGACAAAKAYDKNVFKNLDLVGVLMVIVGTAMISIY